MISVDISNVWGQVSLQELLALEAEVAAAHEALPSEKGEEPELERILPKDAAAAVYHHFRQKEEL